MSQDVDIDNATDAELRSIVKDLLRRQKLPPEPAEPLGVDAYSHLPVFMDRHECPRCMPYIEPGLNPETGLRHYICHKCQCFIPHSHEFQNRGIEGPIVDHLHLHNIVPGAGTTGGHQIRTLARSELCLPCFREDWATLHPDKPCDL